MKVNTRIFGEVDIENEKIIEFPGGIIGFPQLTKFALIHNEEKGVGAGIRWLQSMQEEGFAMPVMDPLVVQPDYNPEVEDELLKDLGELNADNLLVLVTVTVPTDLTKMTVNLKGPIVVNSQTKKACQVIVEGDAYVVKFPIYDILQAGKAGE
ncbi:MAG: flagellar assembly protein FliW [Lachnospiraceae bacterium]|nr:flagellar assembly protein FliW [Lachnospiraceae bacterium]